MAPEKKPGLSRERILTVAAQLAEDEGLEALSMRRLAQELDVWPMSVYTYFRDKEELVDAVAIVAAADFDVDPEDGSWREQIVDLLGQIEQTIARDPSGLGARMSRAFLSPALLSLSEAGLAILQRAGFDPREAARAWRALWSYTYGYASFALGESTADARRRVRMAVAALPDDDFPTLLASADEFAAALSDDDAFEHGLDLLLDELERRLGLSRTAASS